MTNWSVLLFCIMSLEAALFSAQATADENSRDSQLVITFVSKLERAQTDSESCTGAPIFGLFVWLDQPPPDLKRHRGKQVIKLTGSARGWEPSSISAQVGDTVRYRIKNDFHLLPAGVTEGSVMPSDDPAVESYYLSFARPVPRRFYSTTGPSIEGWILVADHRWHAVSDAKGKVELVGLPEGEHQLHLWHPSRGWITQIVREAGRPEQLSKGLMKISVDQSDQVQTVQVIDLIP